MCLFVLNFFKLNQGFGGYILFEIRENPVVGIRDF